MLYFVHTAVPEEAASPTPPFPQNQPKNVRGIHDFLHSSLKVKTTKNRSGKRNILRIHFVFTSKHRLRGRYMRTPVISEYCFRFLPSLEGGNSNR